MNTYYIGSMPVTNELYHFGIKGQKWGIRRYQNPDGTLTEAGKKRYGYTQQDENWQMLKNEKTADRVTETKSYKAVLVQAANRVSDFEKENGRLEDVQDELNEAFQALTKQGDNKLWEEYAKYYVEDQTKKGKIDDDPELKELLFMECMKKGRGSIDWSDDAWRWYCDKKNPSIGRKEDKLYELEMDLRKYAEVYSEKFLGDHQWDVASVKYNSKHPEIVSSMQNGRQKLMQMLDSDFYANFRLSNIL